MNLVILTNIITPYRRYMYDEINRYILNNHGQFHVLVMAKEESNRHWEYDEYKTHYTILLQKKIIIDSIPSGYFSFDLKERLLELQPDILVAAGGYNMLPVIQAIFFRKRIKYKLLFWSESNLIGRETISIIKKINRSIIRYITYNCFDGFWNAGKLSDEFISQYKKNGVPSFFMPNLVDIEFYKQALEFSKNSKSEIKKRYSLSETKKILICPARLSYEKGILEFLDLYPNIVHSSNAILLLVGDGPLHTKIELKIRNISLDIRLLGYKNQNEILQLYSISDIFLLPSNIDPNPLSCIEALHCGLPLLVSEHVGNFPEVIVKGKNGYVFSYKNKNDAISIIDNIIMKDDQWFENARKESLQIANTIYNPQNAIQHCITEMQNFFFN